MKTPTIPAAAYRGLTVQQRLAAAIAARGRDDETEVRRLLEARPDQAPAVTSKLDFLAGLAIAHECDLREAMLCHFVAGDLDDDGLAADALQRIANLRAGWRLTIEGMGLDPDDVEAAGPPRSAFWPMIESILPEPDLARAEAIAEEVLTHGEI